MENVTNFGKNIFPTDLNLEEISNFFKNKGIELSFLFEDGIEVKYSEEYQKRNYPGSLSLWKNGMTVFTFSEEIDSITITNGEKQLIINIEPYL